MYLHSLEIHGFKSFGRKTKFIFTTGLSGIVGPNGCGKSNILDAIRWVLGEQKAGFLRSERMDNVIFNGTPSLKPLGMAEVSMTIQNTKNILPIEYTEVVITRRLFRSSESQYLLNNAPCRLKDIQNLFMDTGMGPDAYSIIELSMVESILSGKAEERRRILEEAAGVTKYKLRRKAAFRKLEATAADLLRVDDIVHEVEKNVNSLHRQVRKAQRYQEFRTDLREKEIVLSTHMFSKIHLELEPMTHRLIEMQNKREALRARFDEKEADNESARLKLLEIEKKLSGEQKNLNEIFSKIQKKEEELLISRERRNALTETKERLARNKDEIKVRMEKHKVQFEETENKLQQLFGSIQEAESDYQEKHVALKSAEVRVHEKKSELKRIEDKRLEIMAGLSERKKEEERLKTRLEHYDERLSATARELEEMDLLQNIRQEKLNELQEKKVEAQARLRDLKDQQEKIHSEIEQMGHQRDQLKEEILAKKGEIQAVKERIALLKKFIESYEDHPEGVQHLLRTQRLNGGMKGTLGEILSVESKYRRAVETALGEAAVSLIVDGVNDAMHGIDILKSDKKGAVTFLPIERFAKQKSNHESVAQEIRTKPSKGVIDWAYNLVRCGDEYRPLVRALLSDFLVVSDLESAKLHSSRWQQHHMNLVTLNGEIVSTWGPIKGGVNGSDETAIVGRKVLVEELQKRLQSLSQELQDLERAHQDREKRYAEAVQKSGQTGASLKKAEGALTDLEVKEAQLNFEAKKEAEARDRILKERQSLSDEQLQLTEQLGTMSPSLGEMDVRKHDYDSDYERIYEELSDLEAKYAEQNTIAQDSRVRLVDLKGEEKRLQEEIARIQDFEKELQEQSLRIDNDIKAATVEQGNLEKRIEEIKSILHEDFEKRQGMENLVHQTEHEYLLNKQLIEEKEKALKEIRIERDQAAEEVHQLEMRVSELQMEERRIKDRIKEEYDYVVKASDELDENLDPDKLQENINVLKNRIKAMEPVNLLALKEYEKEKERLNFLTTQKSDLLEAEANLAETIKVINKTAREQFQNVFEEVRENFIKVFNGFFAKGKANLKLETSADPLESDIIIEADPKGRKLAALTLLSGGEKTLTAISLLLAIYLVKPSPFCILDEVDAPLDDANVGRFISAIQEYSKNTQFIVITHNKLTMRAADCLYGITMEEEGVSKVVSVNFKDLQLEN